LPSPKRALTNPEGVAARGEGERNVPAPRFKKVKSERKKSP